MELLDIEDTGRPRQPDETTDSLGPAEFQQEVLRLFAPLRQNVTIPELRTGPLVLHESPTMCIDA